MIRFTLKTPLIWMTGGALAVASWAFAGGGMGALAAAESAVKLPAPSLDLPTGQAGAGKSIHTATFAGGCFWGVQAVFQHTQGVLNAVSGYAGGDASTAKYSMIGSGRTGHAEAVQITYDPTTLNRQGPDRGTQYRSAIFTHDAAQKKVAENYIAELDAAKVFPDNIVTQLTPLTAPLAFYPAEALHQDYATLNPRQPYIARFDLPKIANLKSLMPEVYRDKPVLVLARDGA